MKEDPTSCIYLDHHATTPTDRRVVEKMMPFFFVNFGNPSSDSHPFGWHAQEAVDQAREMVAKAIHAHPSEIIFTSGATESSNMAIKGLFWPTKNVKGCEIVTSSIEHGATLSCLSALAPTGIKVALIKPSRDGIIDTERILDHLSLNTALVSVFLVHNEIGVINPIAEIAKEVKKRGILFHCDAAQALGRVKIDCEELGVDMMSFSGHKAYGPKGVGCLYVKRSVMDLICPLIHGGGQEWLKRSGTLNVPGIVGMGEAARLAVLDFDEENQRIGALRDHLLAQLMALDGVFVNGSLKHRVSSNLNVSISGIDGEELILAIAKRVAVSSGSACASSSQSKSRVLLEMGISADLTQASIRFGLGRGTKSRDIDIASSLIAEQIILQRKGKKKLIKLIRS